MTATVHVLKPRKSAGASRKGKRLTHAAAQRFGYKANGPRLQRIWDTEVPGLGLEAFASGRKSWIFRYRIHGKQRVMTVGAFADFDLDGAREKSIEARAQVRAGEDPLALREAPDEGITLDGLWERYRKTAAFASCSEAFRRNMESTVTRYLLPDLGHLPVGSIKRFQIARKAEDLIESRREGAARALLARSRVLFNFALERELLEHSPADHIKPRYVTRGRRETWLQGDEELRAAWNIEAPPQFVLMARWLLLTGCRRDEARLTTWSQIEDGAWRLPKTKNGLPLVLPVMPMMQTVLDESRATFGATDYLFPATTSNFRPATAESWQYALKAVAQVRWSAHVLRHTVESHLAELGVPEESRDAVLNHVRRSTGARYQHSERLEVKRAALDVWHGKLQALVASARDLSYI